MKISGRGSRLKL